MESIVFLWSRICFQSDFCMARNMWFSTALVVLLLYVAVTSEEVQAKSFVSPTLSYWHRKLATTPIPDFLQELIFPFSSHKKSEVLDAIREGNKVSVGELGREEGPDVDAMKTPRIRYETAADDDDMIKSDPLWSAMFFLEEELHSGTNFTLYRKLLKKSTPDSGIFFLPRPLAEAIPFSSHKLSVALQMLNISQGSHTALAMKHTLQVCESPANGGEIRYCAISLESMIDYATSTLGTSGVSVLETNVPCKVKSQRYTITGIPSRSKSGLGSVVCHMLTYPYAVYLCHQIQNTTTIRLSLKGEDGSSGEGVAVCHTDTSGWNPRHVAFKLLNVKPGGSPICHFLLDDDVLWLPAN